MPMPYTPLAELSPALIARAARVRLAAFDVDGTLTDGRLWLSGSGDETKQFHVHDGFGLKRLRAYGVEVAIVTARVSQAAARRAEELGIAHFYQGQRDKRACLDELLDALGMIPEQAAFVGDDLPDLAVMHRVGLAVAVANAHPWLSEHTHWQTQRRGGHGAVREVCDLILAAQGHLDAEKAQWL